MLEDAINIFVTFFVILDPIGLAPIFISLTGGMSNTMRRSVAIRAVMIGFVVLAAFGLVGEGLLSSIGIGMAAFQIAGGLLLFLTALEMLFERRGERRSDQAERDHPPDPSVFPLAIPMIAGPGAIAAIILQTEKAAGDPTQYGLIYAMLVLVLICVFITFLLAPKIEKLLGHTGIIIVTRLFGLLLAALAVQFVINGLYTSKLIAS